MATAPGEYNKCEVVYLPYLKKYVRFEDVCAQCTSDWSGGLAHIDMWIGSTTSNGGQNVVNCENSLTPDQGQAVIRNPASDLPVNSAELFLSGRCHTENVYKNQDPSQFCSGGGDNGGDGSCSWPGHCAGASCSDVNDCSDDLICLSGSCGSQ
ncbi:hypothetical protein PHISCL_08388 [Aspergillus sclerotialis]|uniref:Uncharacterized protein n=1 Tax=Aspergillus sclerotialis TaxID=2070753 RepID=A0A3A2Z844_9EURO|nr:hypothetical protein PHISCL_08388 [Aspergillus sclerotialis]